MTPRDAEDSVKQYCRFFHDIYSWMMVNVLNGIIM